MDRGKSILITKEIGAPFINAGALLTIIYRMGDEGGKSYGKESKTTDKILLINSI